MQRLFAALSLLVILGVPATGYAQLEQRPLGFVTDNALLLNPEERLELEQKLRLFEASTTIEIAIVTIPQLPANNTIELYAVELFERWGIGKKNQDNGVLFLTALEDRATRIEVGYGLEGALTDAQASSIIRNTVLPSFQEKHYNKGILEGTEAIMQTIQGEAPPQEQQTKSSTPGGILGFIGFGVILIQWLIGIMERSKSWWLGGVFGGVGGVILTLLAPWGLPLWGGVALAVLFVITGLFIDKIVSEGYQEAKSQGKVRAPWYTGGGGFGGGLSSGGGFGGFGGGSSGGGGASGRW